MAATLQLFLTGGAENSDPNASLGGVKSGTQVSGTPLNNLFDDVQPSEAVSGDTEYRAVDIYNAGDANAVVVKVYIDPDTPSPKTELDLGLDSTTQSVINEGTAPTDVSFAHYTPASKLSVGDIAPGAAQRLWLKRTVQAGAANLANDGTTIKMEYA